MPIFQKLYGRVYAWWKIRRARRIVNRLTAHQRRENSFIVNNRRVHVETIAQLDGSILHWTGTEYFSFWNKRLPFDIFVESNTPTDAQLELLGQLMAGKSAIRKDTETAIFNYYRQNIAPYGPVDWEMKPLPVASSLRDLLKTISDKPTVNINWFSTGQIPTWSLSFNADWDDEHGVVVDFEGFSMKDVGK